MDSKTKHNINCAEEKNHRKKKLISTRASTVARMDILASKKRGGDPIYILELL